MKFDIRKIVVTLLLFLIFVPQLAYAEQNDIKLILSLGLLESFEDGTFRPETYVSNKELFGAVSKIAESGSADAEELKGLGLIKSADVNGDAALKADDLIFSMVHLLGYKGDDYTKIASDSGLYKGVDLKGGYVTRAAFSRVLYNTLLADRFKFSDMAGDKITFEKSGNLLKDVFNIERVVGVVTADSTAYLNKPSDKLAKGEMLINGVHVSGVSNTKDYIARRVEAFLKFEEKSETSAESIVISPYKNDEVRATSEFIDGATTSYQLVWLDADGEKLNKRKIPDDAVVIHNGIRMGTAKGQEWSLFTPGDGEVNLIDNNDDGEAEAVIIWSYIPYLVDYVTDDTIYDKIGRNPIKLENKEYSVFAADGTRTTIDKIKPFDVISVAYGVSESDEITIRISGKEPVSGIYTRDGYSILIGRDEYSLSGWCDLNGAKNGDNVTIYLDMYNRPVYVTKTSDSEYGYLSGISCDSDEERIFFKLYTFNGGVKKYEAADKISLNENGTKTKYIKGKSGANSYEALSLYLQSGQLVKFKLNSDLKIKEIQLPGNKIYQNMPNTDAGFDLYYAVDSGAVPQFRTAKFLQNMLASRCRITEDTKMLSVEGNPQKCEDFKRVSLSDLVSDGDYEVVVYDLNEKFEAGAVIFKTLDTPDGWYSKFGSVVKSVSYAVGDGGEVLMQIDVYTLGEEKTLYADDTDILSDSYIAEKFQNGGIKLSEVCAGDVIYYNLGSDNRISSFAILHKNDGGEFYHRSNYGWGGNYIPNAAMAVTYCRVEKTYSDLIVADIDGFRPIPPNQWRHYYIYEKSKNKLRTADVSDVRPGDKIVGLWKWSNMNDLIIYR